MPDDFKEWVNAIEVDPPKEIKETVRGTIQHIYGLNPNRITTTDDLYGVEIELENCIYPNNFDRIPYVTIKEDQSLRNNGYEFVTDPLPYSSTLSQLTSAIAAINKTFPEVDPSFRAGVHVHINVKDLTPQQLFRLLTLYYIVEPVIYSVCGDRSDNLFCVPWRGSVVETHLLTGHWKEDIYTLEKIRKSSDKYAGLNIRPIDSLGTIECRILPAYFWNSNILFGLIHTLFNIKLLAKEFKSPKEFDSFLWDINSLSTYERILRLVFSGHLPVDYTDTKNQKVVKLGVFKYKLFNPR